MRNTDTDTPVVEYAELPEDEQRSDDGWRLVASVVSAHAAHRIPRSPLLGPQPSILVPDGNGGFGPSRRSGASNGGTGDGLRISRTATGYAISEGACLVGDTDSGESDWFCYFDAVQLGCHGTVIGVRVNPDTQVPSLQLLDDVRALPAHWLTLGAVDQGRLVEYRHPAPMLGSLLVADAV